MRWLAIAAGFLCLGSVLSAATSTPTAASLIPLGPLEFLRPILLNVLSQNALLTVQTSIGNVVQAVISGDATKILSAVMEIVDPMNVTLDSLMILGNYESHMWDDGFRQQIGRLMNGLSKAFTTGIDCFSHFTRDNINNFTSKVVVAMDKAFVANRPNTTAPPQTGLAGVPTAALSTARVIFDVLTGSEMSQAVNVFLNDLVAKFPDSYQCARANAADVNTSWQSLTAQLTGGTVAPPTTTTPKASSFWGLF